MRADARRNRNAVLEAGARLLAERPTASMQEIADASGVGRTTVYRHFPAREDLVEALVTQVAEEAMGVTMAAISMEGSASEVLRRLAKDVAALGRRWSFLRAQRAEIAAATRDSDQHFHDWVIRKQRAGELRSDFEAPWIQAGVRGLLTAAVDDAERLGPEEAGRLAGETLVSAFAKG
jgi:AcrR family transcriptional regulator